MADDSLFEKNMGKREQDLERAVMLLEGTKSNIELENFDAPTIAALEETMELFEKWEVKEKMAEVYQYWGIYQRLITQFDESIAFLQKGLAIQLSLFGESNKGVWNAYSNIGITYLNCGNISSAKKYSGKALDLAFRIFGESHTNTAISYSNFGAIYFQHEEYSEAIRYFEKQLDILKKLPLSSDSESSISSNYSDLATCHFMAFNYDKAEYYFAKSLQLAPRVFNPMSSGMSTLYINYGIFCEQIGDNGRALLFLKKAVHILESCNNKDVLYAYRAMMGIYMGQNDFRKMIEIGDKTLHLLEDENIKQYRTIPPMYQALGYAHQEDGNNEKALFFLKKGVQVAINRYGKHHHTTVHCLKALGQYYSNIGDLNNYKKTLDEALELLDTSKPFNAPLHARLSQNFGSFYQESKNFLASIKAYHKGIQIAIKNYTNPDLYDYPKLNIVEDQSRVNMQFREVLHLFLQKAYGFFLHYTTTQNIKDIKTAVKGYKLAFDSLNQIRQSFQSEQSKMMIIIPIWRSLLTGIPVSYTLYTITQEEQYFDLAFEFIESNKAYLMLNNKRDKTAKKSTNIPSNLLHKEKELKTQLTMIQKNIQIHEQKGNKIVLEKLHDEYFHTHNKFDTLKQQLEINYPDYYREKYSTSTVSVRNIQSSLQENQTVLSYFIGEEKIYLFAITSNEYEVFALDKPSNWTNLIQNYLQSIKLHQKAEFYQLSFELYQILLQEAIHHIIDPFEEEAKQVFIIPHTELHYLPFETLIVQQADASEPYQDLDYLLNHCQISYHYSATLLHIDLQKEAKTAAERAPTDIAFTGFAPVYTSSSNAQKQALKTLQTEYTTAVNRSEAIRSDGTWTPLPHSKLEVENISQLFKQQGFKSQAFLYQTANKSNLEKQISNSRFVLIAAHGIVNDEYPELSGLVLSSADEEQLTVNGGTPTENENEINKGKERNLEQVALENCILNMKEVAMIPMSADLVVLSSCESGIGELHKGEGMMAVNRGFLASGAKNVVSTLFKVNDRASSELTQLLFQFILEGESYLAALQKAKLSLLQKKGMSPKAWSGFVLFGTGLSL